MREEGETTQKRPQNNFESQRANASSLQRLALGAVNKAEHSCPAARAATAPPANVDQHPKLSILAILGMERSPENQTTNKRSKNETTSTKHDRIMRCYDG